jgi:hypothetical protein
MATQQTATNPEVDQGLFCDAGGPFVPWHTAWGTLGMPTTDWNAEIVNFATSFTSLSFTPNGDKPPTIRVRRGIGDLMHTIGYFVEQNGTSLREVSMASRLRLIAAALVYMADHLEA